jgi:heterodisulfide reductase subunit C
MKNREAIQALMIETRAQFCVECGRCVAVCPMAEMYPNFSVQMSPRGLIKKVLMGADILSDEHIWYCTECNAGTDVCPAGVSDRDLIRGLRRLAIESGAAEGVRTCRECGQQYVPTRVMDYVSERLKDEPKNFLELCPSCRRKLYLSRNA